ncbi:hypothetical protein BN2475_410037 [Paraburkholderia ribeironis]|uniref:Uncharacterized protein n=1 Tax=Paraburkholderia ribeironis TaxID=1247936 RepID=A0A1N7S779_9BURK|nr:hypothetical protein BN2475_410037 [Paraburkholderia ribeironis]
MPLSDSAPATTKDFTARMGVGVLHHQQQLHRRLWASHDGETREKVRFFMTDLHQSVFYRRAGTVITVFEDATDSGQRDADPAAQ